MPKDLTDNVFEFNLKLILWEMQENILISEMMKVNLTQQPHVWSDLTAVTLIAHCWRWVGYIHICVCGGQAWSAYACVPAGVCVCTVHVLLLIVLLAKIWASCTNSKFFLTAIICGIQLCFHSLVFLLSPVWIKFCGPDLQVCLSGGRTLNSEWDTKQTWS